MENVNLTTLMNSSICEELTARVATERRMIVAARHETKYHYQYTFVMSILHINGQESMISYMGRIFQ
jgi:hypothetical protein